MPLHFSTLTEDSLLVDWLYQSYVVIYTGCDTWLDFIFLDMVHFNVIFGLNLLDPYHVILDCYA